MAKTKVTKAPAAKKVVAPATPESAAEESMEQSEDEEEEEVEVEAAPKAPMASKNATKDPKTTKSKRSGLVMVSEEVSTSMNVFSSFLPFLVGC